MLAEARLRGILVGSDRELKVMREKEPFKTSFL